MNQHEITLTIEGDKKFILSESRYFITIDDLAIGLRALTNQLINCWATTSNDHAAKLASKIAAHICIFFDHSNEQAGVKPRNLTNFSEGLLLLDDGVTRVVQFAARGAKGDARSEFMNLLGILSGLMEFGTFEERYSE